MVQVLEIIIVEDKELFTLQYRGCCWNIVIVKN